MAWWFWIVLGLALLGLELAFPGGFFLVFFGLSAMLIGLLTVLMPGLSAGLAWLLFSVVAVILLVLFRQRLIRSVGSGASHAVDSLVGEDVEVTEEIAPGAQGGVRLRGAPWRAENKGDSLLAPSSRAQVIAVDGLVLHIK